MITQMQIRGEWFWVFRTSTGELVYPCRLLIDLIDELHAVGLMP